MCVFRGGEGIGVWGGVKMGQIVGFIYSSKMASLDQCFAVASFPKYIIHHFLCEREREHMKSGKINNNNMFSLLALLTT